MAWNEPGKQNDRDPWSGNRGGGDQGPPDLDELIRKLQNNFSRMFGGKGGRGAGGPGGSGSGAKFGGGLLILVVVALALVWAASGFYTVDQQERGVVLRLGKFKDIVQPGLHWNPTLIDQVGKVNVTKVNSLSSRGTMLTMDENIVEISLSVQYVVADPRGYYLNVREPELSLAHATDSALRHVVGSSTMDSVLTEGRALLASEVHQRLQSYIDNYGTGLLISQVNIEDAQAPKEVQAAFDDVIKAREDEQREKNQAQTYANGIIPVARGQAQRVRQEAVAYKEQVIARSEGEADRFTKLLTEYQQAPQVTRQRLYIDAVEAVYAATTKVMVDVEGGNNMLYLPLDKIMDSSAVRGTTQFNARELENLTNEVLERVRQRQAGGGLREGR